MKTEEVKKRILENEDLRSKITDMSYAMDESDQNSRELWVTVWNDGVITASLTQRGSNYPPETYNDIDKTYTLKRSIVWETFNRNAEKDNGTAEEDMETRAIESYKETFDLEEYLNKEIQEYEEE